MTFSNTEAKTFLIFFIIIFIISFLAFSYFKKKKNLEKKYSFFKENKIKYIFLFLSFFLIVLTIFEPRWTEIKSSQQANWIDVVFALDVSKSMNVPDIKWRNYSYTRLDFAKQAIANFIVNKLSNRFWLVIFAWDALSSVPLTLDHDVFLTFLKWVDYRNIFKQWTDLKKAVKLALQRFDFSNDRSKAVIIISDWADSDYKIDENYFKNLKEKYKNVEFFVVWVWTEKWWRIIKKIDAFWRPIYQKYKWQYVISKINKYNLEKLADSLWASYLWASYIELKNIWDLKKFESKLNSLEKKAIENNSKTQKNDLTRIFVFLSFIFFLIYLGMWLKLD